MALTAKFNVDIVYDIDYTLEESVAISIVFEFPPRESLNILVNTESLYGICVALEDNFYITMLREVKDLLMFDAYFSLYPAVNVDFCF